jgi:hypothetical protein
VPGTPVLEFGAAAAVYDLAQRLDIVGLIDRHVSKRRSQGPSVGTLLLLAAINRAVAATSKARLATWYERTSLSRWMRLQAVTRQSDLDGMRRPASRSAVP